MKAEARSIPLPVVLLVSAWFVFVICAFSDAGIDIRAFLALVYGGLLWGVVWLVRLIVSLVRQRRGSTPRQPVGRAFVYWGLEPAALLLSAVLAFTGVLFHLRFHLSLHALDSYADAVVAGKAQPHGFGTPGRRVGLFQARETELLSDDVVRIITARDGFNHAGFTLSPHSPPPVVGEDSYTHITGFWYHWHRSW